MGLRSRLRSKLFLVPVRFSSPSPRRRAVPPLAGPAVALIATLLLLLPLRAGARPLRIETEHHFAGKPLTLGQMYQDATSGNRLSVTRLDYLLSELSLQRMDGTWLESQDWFAYFSLKQERSAITLPRGPVGIFQAVRFRIGLNPEANASNPDLRPPSHALHPQVNGLHWGWQGGYVFMALEGRYRKADQTLGGYSYHIANNENLMTVVLPVRLDTSRHSTLTLRLNVDRIFNGPHLIHLGQVNDSTHSRGGDLLAAQLKSNIEAAFEVVSTGEDLYHAHEIISTNAPVYPKHTIPYPLHISERLPRPDWKPDNPLTVEGVSLGGKLFNDPILSRNNLQSCADCHDRRHAFTDSPKRFSVGVNGATGKRNAMPLFNLIFNKGFFWDGRVRTLREQVLVPIQDPAEMDQTLDSLMTKLNAHPDYPALFKKAFGGSPVTPEQLGLALEQYLFTELSQDSRFDRAIRDQTQFTDQEKRGFQLFVTEFDPQRNLYGADCFHCHGGSLFTNQDFANNGLDSAFADPGRFLVTGQETDRGKLKVPSLRNVEVSGPYMHDGRFATLEEVIEHYNSGVKPSPTLDPNLAKHPPTGLNLSEADKKALITFLKTVTDDTFLEGPLETTQPGPGTRRASIILRSEATNPNLDVGEELPAFQ